MGRPQLEIDPHKVELLAGCGCTVAEIAAKLNCSKRTLETRFCAHIEKGREAGKGSLRSKQFERAMKGSDTMLIWLGKQLLGQAEKIEQSGTMKHEHRNADEECVLAAAEEIRFRRLVGDVGEGIPSGVHEGDVPSL